MVDLSTSHEFEQRFIEKIFSHRYLYEKCEKKLNKNKAKNDSCELSICSLILNEF